MEAVAHIELGMSSEEFWKLTWYEWGLWCLRIVDQRRKRNEDRELSIEMTRSIMTLQANIHRGKRARPYEKTDFFKLSYDDQPTDRKMVGIDNAEFMKEMKERFGKKKPRG